MRTRPDCIKYQELWNVHLTIKNIFYKTKACWRLWCWKKCCRDREKKGLRALLVPGKIWAKTEQKMKNQSINSTKFFKTNHVRKWKKAGKILHSWAIVYAKFDSMINTKDYRNTCMQKFFQIFKVGKGEDRG